MLIWKGLTPSRLASVLAWFAQTGRSSAPAVEKRPVDYSTVASPSIKD
jgi:hypothetical protein